MKLSVLDLPAGHRRPRPAAAGAGAAARDAVRRRRQAARAAGPRGDRRGRGPSRRSRACAQKDADQLGTSGSGNHFVEFGVLDLAAARPRPGGRALRRAALAHGPRGAGAPVASHYSKLARDLHPELPRDLGAPRLARPRHRGGPGILGGDEPDGRLRRGQPRGHPPARRAAPEGGRPRRRREPPQLRLEGNPRRPRTDRPPQGRHAGRRGRARRHPRLDGQPGVRRPRPRGRRTACSPPRTAPAA